MGLKIAMVTPWKCRCGIFSYSRDLINALVNLGVEVYVVRLPRFGAKSNEIMRDVAERVPFNEVDCVHIQHEYGLYHNLEEMFYGTLKRFGKPVVSTLHAVGNHKIDPVVSKYSDLMVVHNKFCKGVLTFPCIIIPHGCSVVEPEPMSDSKIFVGVDSRIPIVGYLGFISEYKGVDLLINAMKAVKNAGLLIGGGGHTGHESHFVFSLKQNSFELLPGRCQWLGFIPDEQLNTVYSAMNIVVYPSLYATESGALLTAMSHGKAVIASRLKPFVEKEKIGALTTFRGVRNLSNKIKKLLKDDEYRIKLENGAKKYCEENSWENVAKKHVYSYNRLLEK